MSMKVCISAIALIMENTKEGSQMMLPHLLRDKYLGARIYGHLNVNQRLSRMIIHMIIADGAICTKEDGV